MTSPDRRTGGNTLHYIVIVALVAGVGGLGYQTMQLRTQLRTATDDLGAGRKNSASTANFDENRALRAQVQELEAKLAAVPAPGQALAAAAPAAPNPMANALSALMNNPGLRATLSDTMKRTVEVRYAELLNRLQLSPEDRAKFVDLLAQRSLGPQDATLKLMAGNISADERRALTQQIRDDSAAAESRVRDFLGEPNYAEYKDYNQQMTARTQLAALNAPFAQAGEPLSADQQANLTAISTEERRGFAYTNDLNANDADPAAVLDDGAVATYMRESQELNDRVASRAAAYLTPTQLVVFQKQQASQLQTRKAALELGRQLMGGAAAKK